MDLTVESSTANSGLLFSANPDIIPEPGKPVLLFIKPDLSTNPAEEVIATAEQVRAEHEARMTAEFEKRMRELEARESRTDDESNVDEIGQGSDPAGKDGGDN